MNIGSYYPLHCALILALLLYVDAASASKWDSPKKLDDQDVAIELFPQSGDPFVIVIKKALIPGTEFWQSPQRSFVFGEDGDSGPFERPVTVSPDGGIRDDAAKWWVYLAKYETTVGPVSYTHLTLPTTPYV